MTGPNMFQRPTQVLVTTRKRLLVGAWCALTIGVVAGCGGASSSTDTAADAPTSTASAATSPTAAPTASAGSSAHDEMIMIEDFEYTTPSSVSPGATVEVMNTDGATHTVTVDEGDAFDADVSAEGTATFTAPTTPGTYAFHCNYHGNMHGVLVVK